MHPVTVLLHLRWLQLRRALPLYGIVLLATALCGAVWLLRAALHSDPSYAPWMAGGMLLTVAGMHHRRDDLNFLLRHVPNARAAMAMEYGIMILPLFLGCSLAGAWLYAGSMFLACVLPWTPVVSTSGVRGRWLRRLIPVRLFEWRSAVQSFWPMSALLWLAALALCWLPVLPLFLLGGIAMLAAGTQEQCEPRSMLLASATDANTLLRSKAWGAIRMMILIQLPVVTGATVAMPEWWWIHALFGVGMMMLVAYAVVLKYANYIPNQRLSANGINVAVAAVFAILPGLGVVPLIMLFSEWPKARMNLLHYFHDHDH